MAYHIITHTGKAHIDEILASALIALKKGGLPESIERLEQRTVARKVEEEDLDDKTWVIDCGLVFDPSRRLFDHHQDGSLPSAALLVFDHFFPHLHDTDLHRYFETVSKVDTGGLRGLEGSGSEDSELSDYWAFSHKLMVRVFEKRPLEVLSIVVEGLKDKIRFEKAKKEAAVWLAKPGHIDVTETAGLKVLRYNTRPPGPLVSAIRDLDGEIVDAEEICAIYGFDDRSAEARTLYRTDVGHEILNLSLCSPNQALFNHQGGFLLRFVPESEEEWKTLLFQSLVDPSKET